MLRYGNLFFYKILWILLFLGRAPGGAAQSNFINSSIDTFVTTNSPGKVISNINLAAYHFHKTINNRVNFGIVGSEYNYTILKLSSAKNREGQCLSIDNTSLDTVSIYRIYNDGKSELLYQGGEMVAFNKDRNYVWHTAPVEIKLAPSFYLIAMKAAQKNINVRYEVLSKDVLQKNMRRMSGLFSFT